MSNRFYVNDVQIFGNTIDDYALFYPIDEVEE